MLQETIGNCIVFFFCFFFICLLFFEKPKIDILPWQDVYGLLSSATKEFIFIFDKNLYCQIDEVAMGSLFRSNLSKWFFVSLWKGMFK